tara:strand:+ start:780 stop:1262 length:483 start_codon:yes stop_codon:yes gene_type:complete
MTFGFWMLLLVFFIYFLPIILCLILIKKKNYKKLTKKQYFAGFWSRLAAGIIDLIILIVVGFILSFIVGPLIIILDILISWLYFVILQSSKKRATFGMQACGIKIHDEQLGRLSFWRLSGRYFATWVSAIILFIGFFMIGFHPRKQGLHDIIARTIHTQE